ncbi:DNA polymerase III subunit delta [Salipiger sp. 1_MG-2023]|uniref:DNA polymerase III subunit delta n=1 Tax=Salipiger sp. 1_MG-2023 TaxID=3062665 RepID=UPI0026E2A51A|nr:DNA polymerase III subunit delta [Salipiger sp. 1_MG-2023]MDO6587300.1 DNA polymerase III subunit delta [Salipiger sp. 1_MG-2023]
MKLTGRDAQAFFRKPDPTRAGVLLFGDDTMRVAHRRQQVIAALIGPEGEAEMRHTRIPAADLRRDPALLLDAIKAQGFFPGPRVAFVEDAGDGLADTLKPALEDWREGDAQVIVTAGQLSGKSKLRKLFEGHRNALSIGIYSEPPGREEIEAALRKAGLEQIDRAAWDALESLARALEPGDFRQVLEKVSLYKLDDPAPLTPDEVMACAPASIEAELDDILHVVAEGRSAEIGPLMQRLEAQGMNPVTLLIMAMRHFRVLYTLASARGGPSAAVQSLRPPLFGPRRERMLRQAQGWSADGLERALGMLMDTDLSLRSAGQRAPAMALVERGFVRLAWLANRR